MADEESSRDGVTVEQSSSWLQRIGQSFAGVLFGIALLIGACVLLFWNEGRAVKTARSLSEGAGLVHTVASDRAEPGNDGKLVHAIGPLAASGPAVDAEFGMRANGVRLVRRVEMFQWTEESESDSSKRLGGGETTRTTYKYSRAWVDHPVDSSRFHDRQGHGNPQMTWRTRNIAAPNIKLGAFAVPESLYGRFGAEQPLAMSDEQAQAFQKRSGKPAQVTDGVLYVGKDPAQPALGDYRITFAEVPRQTASIVARQAGPTFEPYRTQAGGNVALIAAGEVPAADMFKEAQDDNRMWTWLIRAGGALLVFIGFCLTMGPIGVLADVIPILGDVVRVGTGLTALLLTAVLAPVVIAVSWFWYRPIVAAVVLVVGGALAYGTIHWARVRKAAIKPAAAI
jgi:Transmembrane protein 43